MPDIQISKIILRRGPAVDLPGKPTQIDPPLFTPGLDAAEMAFATDQGRLFIGGDPTEGQPNYNRTAYPYRNIEILTENSNAAFDRMHSARVREAGNDDFYSAPLPEHDAEWVPVVIQRNGEDFDYRIENLSSITAIVDYAVTLNETGEPIRYGRMQITYFADSESEPEMIDESYAARDLSISSPDNYESVSVFNRISFRWVVYGPTNNRYLAFEYQNYAGEPLNLRFKLTRPFAEYIDYGSGGGEDGGYVEPMYGAINRVIAVTPSIFSNHYPPVINGNISLTIQVTSTIYGQLVPVSGTINKSITVGCLAGDLDSSAVAYFSAMSVQEPSDIKLAINTFIRELKQTGAWSLLDRMVIPLGTEQASLLDLRDPTKTAVNIGAMSFTPYRGWTGTTTGKYVSFNQGLNAGPNYSLNSAMIFAYSNLANIGGPNLHFSTAGALNTYLSTTHTTGHGASSNAVGVLNSNVGLSVQDPNSTVAGNRMAIRPTSTKTRVYINGARGTKDGTDTGENDTFNSTAMPTANAVFFSSFTTSPDRMGSAGFGGALSDSQAIAFQNSLHTLMTALGANY